jgi:hypothetical protein
MSIEQVHLTEDRWLEFFKSYRGLPGQRKGLLTLRKHIIQADPSLLVESADWVEQTRQNDAQASPTTWEGIAEMAHKAGSKFPQLVAAQWALESHHGRYTTGEHNYFGLKGARGGNVKLCSTLEYEAGKHLPKMAWFLNFKSPEDCVQYLVDRWYKDWKTYKGVNHAANHAHAAELLVEEGYATDPRYAQKLLKLITDHHDGRLALDPPPAALVTPGLIGPKRKPTLKVNDCHLIVNDSAETIKAFDSKGKLLWECQALARGQHGEREWDRQGADTPPGLWKLGKVYRDYETAGGDDATFSEDRRSYGWYSFEMIPLEKQDTSFNRAGIMLHGGGTACGWPSAWAMLQTLHPTLGCVRMHNADLKQKVLPLYEKGTVYVSVYQEA